jgi:hypothetical protein
LPSLITMEMTTPTPQAKIVVLRVEQIKDATSVVSLALILVQTMVASFSMSLTKSRWTASPCQRQPCHGCHRLGWRVDFVTMGNIDVSSFFISITPLVFFMPSSIVKEGKDYKACMFPWEPREIYHDKVEDYKEVDACKGSDRACMQLLVIFNLVS